MVSLVGQQHLKVIYSLSEWTSDPVSITDLAKSLNVAKSTVSESVKKLASMGLVDHEPYKGITLTELGVAQALKAVRAHRLIETFLRNALNYPLEEIHEEAHILQSNVTEKFLNSIERFLDYPEVDPHGDPIPNKDGVIKVEKGRLLGDLDLGEKGKVIRISDVNASLLCYLEKLGIVLGAEIEILERHDYVGIAKVKVGEAIIDLSSASLNSVLVK